MKAKIEIRRNADNEFCRYVESYNDPDVLDYMWSDGNYGCDCNRALFFARYRGEEELDFECGEGAYSVRITDGLGKVIYQDPDWSQRGKE